MTYPVHPNKEPPFPELSPCPWCGGENFRHDLTKHIDPSLGTPVQLTALSVSNGQASQLDNDPCTTRAEGSDG